MEDEPRELLLILAPHKTEEALVRVGSYAQTTQVAPPRVVLVRPHRGVPEDVLARLPGVEVVARGPIDPAIRSALTPAEQIMADAWATRRRKTTRVGQGLPWDAPGFEPS